MAADAVIVKAVAESHLSKVVWLLARSHPAAPATQSHAMRVGQASLNPKTASSLASKPKTPAAPAAVSAATWPFPTTDRATSRTTARDARALLHLSRAPARRGGVCGIKAALEVNPDNRVPVLFRHLMENHVAQVASIVDDDIDFAEGIHGDAGRSRVPRGARRRCGAGGAGRAAFGR